MGFFYIYIFICCNLIFNFLLFTNDLLFYPVPFQNQSLNASGYLNDSTHYDSPNRSGLRSRHIISTLNTSGGLISNISLTLKISFVLQ